MATIKFGAQCDGPGMLGDGCPARFVDYTTGDIISCEDCFEDLCPACAFITHHRTVVSLDEVDLDSPARLGCPDEVAA